MARHEEVGVAVIGGPSGCLANPTMHGGWPCQMASGGHCVHARGYVPKKCRMVEVHVE